MRQGRAKASRGRSVERGPSNKQHLGLCKQTVKTKKLHKPAIHGCQIKRHLRFLACCSFLTHLCGSKRQVTSSLSDATDKSLGCTQCHHLTAVTGCMHFRYPAAVCCWPFDWEPTCEPHQCLAERPLTQEGLRGLSCRGGNGRSAKHHNLNDLVWRAMAKADFIPALKEPPGLLRTDGKRPDGVTLLPWKQGKCAMWDVTVSVTLAESYVQETFQTPGAAAETAAERKTNTSIRHSLNHTCSLQSR